MAVIVDLNAERRRRRGPALAEAAERPPAGRPGEHAPVTVLAAPRLAPGAPPVLAFDPASPETYLVAERADRLFAELVWTPVLPADAPGAIAPDVADRARALGLPFVEPEPLPAAAGAAVARVTALAVEAGRAGLFVLAMTRLAYAGGFDLADDEVLCEAAAAAGLDPDAALAAAVDRSRDAALAAAADRLRAAGVAPLPAVRVSGTWYCGEQRIGDAVYARRALA